MTGLLVAVVLLGLVAAGYLTPPDFRGEVLLVAAILLAGLAVALLLP